MAWRAVLLPAPFGPMMPRMRPSSTWRSTPSSAMVAPNALRRPRASMQGMSALLVFAVQQLFGREPETANRCVDPRPVLGEKQFALGLQQQLARSHIDVHPSAALLLDELLVDELLIGLQNRARVEPVLGSDVAHGGERIAFVENTVEDQRDDTIAKLAVDRLAVVPFTFHSEGARLR